LGESEDPDWDYEELIHHGIKILTPTGLEPCRTEGKDIRTWCRRFFTGGHVPPSSNDTVEEIT